jgi:hypothetical protein
MVRFAWSIASTLAEPPGKSAATFKAGCADAAVAVSTTQKHAAIGRRGEIRMARPSAANRDRNRCGLQAKVAA